MKVTDTSGKRHIIREYKDLEDEHMYKAKQVFKYRYQEKSYPIYAGSISTGVVDSFAYVQFDSVRVEFGKHDLRFIDIFSSGVLNSNIIYCIEDSLCRPNEGLLGIDSTGKTIKLHSGDWYGHFIGVLSIDEPKYLKASPQHRRFKLEINTCYGCAGFSVYFIELVNDKVSSYVDMKDFINGAKLTFVTLGWSEI